MNAKIQNISDTSKLYLRKALLFDFFSVSLQTEQSQKPKERWNHTKLTNSDTNEWLMSVAGAQVCCCPR